MRIRKWITTTVAAAGLVLTTVMAGAFLNTDAAWTKLFGYLLSSISEPDKFEIEVGRVTNPLKGTMTIENVTISDDRGTWFTLDRAHLAWAPFKLLRGKIVIEDLRLDQPVLIRSPPSFVDNAGERRGSENPLRLPELPDGVKIHRLQVVQGVLEEPVLGERVKFEAEGRLVTDDGSTQLDLTLARTDRNSDRNSDRIELTYHYKRDDRLLVELKANEAPGGLVARSASLTVSEPLFIDLHGDGSPADWSARLRLGLGNYVTGETIVDAAWADEFRFSANGTFRFGPDSPKALRAQGRDVDLDVLATSRSDGRIVFERALITSAALRLSATGAVPPSRDAFDGAIIGQIENQQAFDALMPPGIKIVDPSFHMLVSGPFSAPAYDMTLTSGPLETERLRASSFKLSLALKPRRSEAGHALTLDAAVTSPRVTDLDVGRLVGDRVRLGARGSLSFQAWRLDLSEVELDAAAMRFKGRFGLDVGRSEVTGSGTLDLPELAALVPLTRTSMGGAATLSLEQISYQFPGDFAGAISGSIRSLRVGDGANRFAPPGPIRLSARVGGDLASGSYRVDALRIAGEKISLKGSLAANVVQGTAKGQVLGRIMDLRSLPHADGLISRGDAEVELTFDDDTADKVVRAGMAVQVRRLAFANQGLTLAIGSSPRVSGDLSLNADGHVKVTLSELVTTAGRAWGSLRIMPGAGTIGADLRLRLGSLSPLSTLAGVDLSGGAGGHLVLNGPLDTPNGSLKVTVGDLRVAGVAIGDVRGQAELSAATGSRRIVADVDLLEGPAGPGTVSVAAAFAEDGTVVVDRLSMRAYGGTAGGSLRVSEDGLIYGSLRAAIPRLGAIARAFDMPAIAGALSGKVDLGATGGSQTAEIEVTVEAPTLALASGDDTAVTAQSATLKGHVTEPFGELRLKTSLLIADLKVGPRRFQSVRLNVSGPATKFDFDVEAAGENLSLLLQGDANLATTGTVFTLSRVEGVLAKERVGLSRPFTITVGRTLDTLNVAPVALSIGDGSIAGFFKRGPRGLQVNLKAHVVPLSLLKFVEPDLVVGGTVTGTLKMNTGALQGSADVKARLRDLNLPGTPIDGPGLSMDLDLHWDGDTVRADASLNGIGQQPFALKAALPLSVGPAGLPVLSDGGHVAGALEWRGPVAALWDYVPLPDHTLAGATTIDLALAGTVAEPVLSGRISLDNGAYEHLILGTVMRDLDIVVTSKDARTFEILLTATDAGNGRFEVAGRMDLVGVIAGMPDAIVDVAFTARDAVVVRRDDLVAKIDSDLRLKNTRDRLLLQGSVTAQHVEARLIDDMPPSVAEIPVIEINKEEESKDSTSGKSDAGGDTRARLPFAVDVAVRVPKHFFVRGRGLDSEWGGELHVRGSNPVEVVGTIRARRGEFMLAGKAFRMTDDSRISFNGGKIDPRVDVTATYEGPDVTASIHLTGPVADPSLSLSSVPPYPKDEILSRVLFNQAPQSLSAYQAATLASTAATLSGIGGGAGAIGRVREELGLDVLRFSGDDGGKPKATFGKYVADNVFISATQGATAGSTAAKVEVEITDHITVESDVGPVSGSNIGINWEWKY